MYGGSKEGRKGKMRRDVSRGNCLAILRRSWVTSGYYSDCEIWHKCQKNKVAYSLFLGEKIIKK